MLEISISHNFSNMFNNAWGKESKTADTFKGQERSKNTILSIYIVLAICVVLPQYAVPYLYTSLTILQP